MTYNKVRMFASEDEMRMAAAIAMLRDTYASELARAFDMPVKSVQRIAIRLEDEGVIAGIPRGRTRRFRLNPRYYASKELKPLLVKFAGRDEKVGRALASLRLRPRKRNKPLVHEEDRD